MFFILNMGKQLFCVKSWKSMGDVESDSVSYPKVTFGSFAIGLAGAPGRVLPTMGVVAQEPREVGVARGTGRLLPAMG